MTVLHEETTRVILGAAFEVANELGAGFLENVYGRAMQVALKERRLSVEMQVPLKVKYHGVIIGDYVADMVVADKVLVELKAVKNLLPEHQAQVINYLKATNIDVGLLINFGSQNLEYKRLYRG